MKKIIFILAFFLFFIQNNIQAQKISELTKVTSVKASDYVPLNIELGATDSTKAILIQNFYKSLKSINDTSAYRIFIVPTRDTTTIGAFYRVMNDSVLVFNKISTRKDTIATWARVRQFGFDTSKVHTLTNSLNIRSKLSLQGINGRLILPDLADSLGGIYKFNNSLLSRYSLGFNYDASNNKDTLITNNALRLWLATKSNYLKTTYPMALNGDSLVMRYQPVNLKLTNNRLDLIQNIRTTDSPTFGGLTINGNSNLRHILPQATDTYDIGSSTLLWRKGWLSELESLVFAKNTISLLGGWFYVTKNCGALLTDVAAGTTTIDFGTTLYTNDFIVLRNNGQVEYMQVTGSAGGTSYNVTRDVDGSGANAWPVGTAFADLGYNNGRIELNAYTTPRLSILKQGTSYNSQTEYIRLGDLNGFLGYSSETYGIAIGEAAKYLKYDPANGLRIAGSVTISDGSAGGWTLDATKIYSTNSYLSSTGYISFGATPPTSYGNNVGAWLGYSSGAKLSLYSDANNYMQWNGSGLSIGGATITGGFLQTSDRTNTAVSSVLLDGANNTLEFRIAGRSSATDASFKVYGNSSLTYCNILNGTIAGTGTLGAYSLSANSSYGRFYIQSTAASSTGVIQSESFGAGANVAAIVGLADANHGGSDNTHTAYGVSGTAYNGLVAYGIYGTASLATTNWAGYFDAGNVYIKNELQVGANKFTTNSSGQITKVNNLSATNKYALIGDGTSFTPRAIAATDIDANVSNTEFSYLDGVTSSIQTQLFAKQYGELAENNATDTIVTRSAGFNRYDYTNVVYESGVSGSAGTDCITINNAGIYEIEYDVTYTVSAAGAYYWALIDGSNNTYARTRSAQTTATSTYTHAHGKEIVSLSATNTVGLGCLSTTGRVVTVIYATITVNKISN